ncbi:MAG: N-acetyltransferase [Bacteroidales bacterium]|jgi:predicted N-acetyltransferase YhbS
MLLKIDNLIIAETHYDEFAETIELTRRAFWDLFQPGCDEHLLLARLRESACYIPELDMVAIEAGVIVGHALATVAAVECVVMSAEENAIARGVCGEEISRAGGVYAVANGTVTDGTCAEVKEAAVCGVCAEANGMVADGASLEEITTVGGAYAEADSNEVGGVYAACRVVCVGPVSVLPERQKEGIGCKLLYHLLERADELGYDAAFLYGHPEYYPRFGFVNAERYGITTRDGKNFDAFMALELSPGALSGITGRFVEDDAFHMT